MKSTISAIIISIVLLSGTAMANSTSFLVTNSSKAKVFNLFYKASEKGFVRVSILDKDNNKVFTEVLFSSASFVRPYNFSELSEGEYTVVLEDKNGKQVEKVNLLENNITSYISASQIVNQENKYRLNITNNGTDVLAVKITSEDGTTLHEELISVTGSYSAVYNLNQVKSASKPGVTFEVTTGNGQTRTIQF